MFALFFIPSPSYFLFIWPVANPDSDREGSRFESGLPDFKRVNIVKFVCSFFILSPSYFLFIWPVANPDSDREGRRFESCLPDFKRVNNIKFVCSFFIVFFLLHGGHGEPQRVTEI